MKQSEQPVLAAGYLRSIRSCTAVRSSERRSSGLCVISIRTASSVVARQTCTSGRRPGGIHSGIWDTSLIAVSSPQWTYL